MRVFFAVVALVALAAAKQGGVHSGQELVPDLFEGQREYVYNYRTLVATGLPRQTQRYAGLEKYGVLTVQVNEQQGNTKILGLRLRHVMSGSFDKEVEDIENRRVEGVAHSTEETIENYGPVFVKVQDNEVQKLKAPENMPEEIINIYRGIASMFTVGKPQSLEGDDHPFMSEGSRFGNEQQPIVYRRQEQGIAGNFETTYEILSNPEQWHHQEQYQQLNLTKTRNYMKQVGPDGRYLQNGHDGRGCQNVCRTHKPEQLEKNMQPELSDWMKPTAEGCPVNFHPKTDLVEAFTTYNYNMTVEKGGKFALIHEAQALDKKILPLRKQQIKTVSLIKLHLVEERPVTENWNQQQATKSYDEITYRFPEGHQWDLQYLSLFNKGETSEIIKDQIVPMIEDLSAKIVSDNVEIKSQTGDKIIQLTMVLGSLSKRQLQSLWEVLGETATAKSATELDNVQRKVLIDTIALSGSNNATELLLDLIQQDKLTTLETVDALQNLKQNLVKPNIRIMQQLKNVCTEPKYQQKRTVFGTACLAFADVVRGHCDAHSHKSTPHHNQQQQEQSQNSAQQGHPCGEQEYRQFVEAIRSELHSAKDFTQQTIFIQTLGRLAHPKAVEALVPYIYGEQEVMQQLSQMKDASEDDSEYVQFIRQIAIYALHGAAQKHGSAIQPIVQGIYFDKQQDYELRTAALSVLLATQPTEALFNRMVIELGQEKDLEVASYTYSALHHLANSTLPCMQQTARRVQNVLGALPEQGYGTHQSKWGAKTRYNPITNSGLKGQWEVTQSNVSAIPRAAWASLSSNKGPYVSTIADFSLVTKGLENLNQFIHKQGGMQKIIENVMQRIRRDTRHAVGDHSVEQVLQQIEEAMQFNTQENDEQPRLVVSGSLLGHEAYLPIDKEYMTKVGQKVGQKIAQLLSEGGIEKTYRYVRVLMPRTYVHVAPAVNGLPVILSNRHPIVVSLSLQDLQTRFETAKGQMQLKPTVIAVAGLIKPTVYHTSVHSALTVNPVQKTRYAYGVRAIEQTRATVPLDVAFQYTPQTQTLAFTIRPRFETVFFHKTRAMTFKTEALLIRGVDKPLLERYTVIKTQQKPYVFDRTLGQKLGMAVRVQGMTENEESAINFMKHQKAFESNPMSSLIQQLSNEWFTPRAWTVRIEKNEQWPAQEIKMIVRLGGNLFQQRMQQKEGQQQQQQTLSKEQLEKEQKTQPKDMRMISYEHEYEKITGRKPETQKLEQSLEQIAQQTEKYWSQVDQELGQQLKKDNTQVRSIEYIISAEGEKKSAKILGHAILASLPSKQAKLAELTMKVWQKPISLKVRAVVASTKTPQPFETQIREEQQRGVAAFVAELETRSTGKQLYSGKIEMSKSDEQKQLMKTSAEQKPWYYKQCEEDKKEQKSEMSTACEKLRVQKSALNKLRFEIELPEQVHERLLNASHKIRETLKARLYRNLRANYVAEKKTQDNKIQGELIYSEQSPEMHMANLTIRTPDHEELRFERIALPKALRPNTMWTLKQQIKAALKTDRPEPTCVYNGHNLRSFDNVTLSAKSMKDGEKYILARENSEKPSFTILAKKMPGGQQTEVEIVLRDATLLKLTPPSPRNGATYQVHVNSTSLEVAPKKTEVAQYGPQNKNMITLHVEEHQQGQDTLVIKVRDQRMRIVYDGKNLKVEIAKQMLKGQLTGLCGNMNNQKSDEFTGPEGCKYEREEDFLRSFGLTKPENHGVQGAWKCPEGVHPRAASSQDLHKFQQKKQQYSEYMQQRSQQRQNYRDEQQQMTEETKMLPFDGKLCFSTEPVRACKEGRRQLETETQSVEFICLKQSHPRTIQLQREVQTEKIASNLPRSGQYGLVYHDVEIPTRCGH
ncbi:vitellogenin-4 [Galendromus occidentalis]|uniref:Vitellogenin-4 n=1 Tax=Galendromus occidentalis TaxID=34638 RepID=A0AAJ7L3F8_9ACAR|nr:vitellogenin-4 [Galendromus occidentalis]